MPLCPPGCPAALWWLVWQTGARGQVFRFVSILLAGDC